MRLPRLLKPANTLVFNGSEGHSISNIPCFFLGFLLGLDGTNDPTITIYDNTTNTGNQIIPTNTYDASQLGLNGAILPYPKYCKNGVYADISQNSSGVTRIEPLLLMISKSDKDNLVAISDEVLG